jgi:pyruvate dehydrogenase E1 component beta subunit
MGLKPVLEFETMSSALKGIDHILNSCAKLHYMSGGELKSGSIVFRGRNSTCFGTEAQLSHCFASYYSNIPGLITVSPFDAEDCKGLLKAAIRS